MMCFGVKDRKRSKTNHCVIVLLDDTQLVHELQPSSTGQDLLDVVIKHLNLLETSYFGLKYIDLSGASQRNGAGHYKDAPQRMDQIWLDVNKSAIKQLRDADPMTVYFGVKYYATDPCKLAEEITRYQFFLQCKQDILHARLTVSPELAVELFALAVQSELGDYDPERHREGYVSEFQFLPHQSVELEKRVAFCHRTLAGQVPATAELNFLERVKWLDLYGCELHPVQYEDNGAEEYAMGLNPSGVLVLRNKLKVAHYLWPRIVKTKCQGRCFLMDVIEDSGSGGGGNNSNSGKAAARSERNRFGFRLADRAASRRLRWAIEEHRSFYHLVQSSATLNQLVQRQQQQQQLHQYQQQQQRQQLKLSQRFRNSIRNAINVDQFRAMQQHLAQQEKLKSSMKSLNNQQYGHDLRQPPTVVRTPSRRYSNRPTCHMASANGNGLPNITSGLSHTMVDSQRQQALMMMSQLNQQLGANANLTAGKAHTLRPMPVSAKQQLDKESAKHNPYYQMMLMMMANGHQPPAHLQQQQQPDMAIVPPGRHIVQPRIYKASSIVNGVEQLGLKQEAGKPPMLMQFFNTKPQYPNSYQSAGHESPRSTKSAMVTSSALKLASKKLAKQQQLLYGDQQDVQPLLAYEASQQQAQLHAPGQAADYYAIGGAAYNASSANPSPRSARSARLASRHKSKSTSENLHLMHNGKYPIQPLDVNLSHSKMLLATTQMMQQQRLSLPPPSYQNSVPLRQRNLNHSDDDSELSKMSKRSAPQSSKKRATFALDKEQANLLLGSNGLLAAKLGSQMARDRFHQDEQQQDEDGDDYCCSRSDCSSEGGKRHSYARQLVRANNAHSLAGSQQRRRRQSAAGSQVLDSVGAGQRQLQIGDQQEWDAIRRRHSEFSSGKGYLANGGGSSLGRPQRDSLPVELTQRKPVLIYDQQHDNDNGNPNDINNNSNSIDNNSSSQGAKGAQLVKSIANKQATPILLSLNYGQTNANNKAVQLLNMQRQQLNSQSSDAGTRSCSSPPDSTPSSVASSPHAPGSAHHQHHHQQQVLTKSTKTSDSAATSSTTTSGYYAGSNSIGSVSVDSDNQTNADAGAHSLMGKQHAKNGEPVRHQLNKGTAYSAQPKDWHEESSRAKIALGSYAMRVAGNRLLLGNQSHIKSATSGDNNRQQRIQKQQFYLGDANNNGADCQADDDENLQSLSQIQQQAPSSLKYVSFDV